MPVIRQYARMARTPPMPSKHFLLESVVGTTAVQPVGHLALVAGILLDVGVQHQQRHPADLSHPDLRVQSAPREWDVDPKWALVIVQQGQRQGVRVKQRITLLLPAGGVERLPEVSLPVEQPNADDRDSKIACGLEMVAGQDAEAARVLRQYLGNAEFR